MKNKARAREKDKGGRKTILPKNLNKFTLINT